MWSDMYLTTLYIKIYTSLNSIHAKHGGPISGSYSTVIWDREDPWK